MPRLQFNFTFSTIPILVLNDLKPSLIDFITTTKMKKKEHTSSPYRTDLVKPDHQIISNIHTNRKKKDSIVDPQD